MIITQLIETYKAVYLSERGIAWTTEDEAAAVAKRVTIQCARAAVQGLFDAGLDVVNMSIRAVRR